MFGLDSCVQAFLKGSPRFHNVCGQVRVQRCEGGVVIQLRVRGLPCGACPCFYRLSVEGGCGCPSLELAIVPAWQGDAALTSYMGGFTPESLIRRCACLAMDGGCGGCIADGVFRPCCDQPACGGFSCASCAPPCCPPPCGFNKPLYPALPPCFCG